MSNLPVLKSRGLNTGNNPSSTPEGSHARADNCVVSFLDRLVSRRGQKYEGYGFGASNSRANEVAFFDGGTVVQFGTGSLAVDSTGVTYSTASGTSEPVDPDLLRMKFCEMAQNLYFNTALGLYGLEDIAGVPVAAGIPKARSQSFSYNISSAYGSFLPVGSSVAYAHVWGKKDANGNVKLGAPSTPIIVSNAAIQVAIGGIVRTAAGGSWPAGKVTVTYTGFPTVNIFAGMVLSLTPGEANFAAGAKTVISANSTTNTFTYDEAGANVASTLVQTFGSASGVNVLASIPHGVTSTSGHFVRFYRSFSVVGTTPPLDLYQVGELAYVGSSPNFSDGTPDIMLNGAPPLYTSPNAGEGIGSANNRPPIAKDIFEFDGRMWFLNTTDKHRFFLNLLGVYLAVPDKGVRNNDTITIGGLVYTFETVSGLGDGDVFLHTTGSVAQNIEGTATELVDAINAHSGNSTLDAYYVSGVDDAPGRILLEERSIGGSAFTAYASRATAWFPALPTSSTGAPASDNSRRLNGLSFSKSGQPEAVPLTNFKPVGPKNHEAIRALPLRDKIFVFIKDIGIYTVSGPAPYRVDRLDTTAKLLVPDSLVEHNNQLIGLFDQGVCAVSDSGVRVLSEPIEKDLLELWGAASEQVKAYAFGVSYESDRQYQLWLPSSADDTVCTQAYVFNSLRSQTGAPLWTHWTGNRTCGRVNLANGLLYLGDGDTNRLRVERKNYNRTDYADESLGVTISAHSGTSVTLASTAGLTAGDLLYQSDAVRSLIVAVVDATHVTVGSTETWSNAGAEVLVAIDCKVKWVDVAPGGPGLKKQFRKAHFHFRDFYVNTFTGVFDSDNSTTESLVTLTSPGFGLTVFGASSFGLAVGTKQRDVEVPPLHQRAQTIRVGFNVREAWSIWAANGYTLDYAIVGDSTGVT